MTAPYAGTTPSSQWPPGAPPYYRSTLIGALAAGVGTMIGSVGPWVSVMLFTVNGLDAGNWGKAGLTLGGVSCAALLTVMFWPHTSFNPRWAVPVAWAVALAGLACVCFALATLIRIMTIPKGNIFGVPVGAGPGWGLWLLVVSSAVLLITASIVANQLAKYVGALPGPTGQPQASWTNGWRSAAIIASAIIVISAIAYFATHWDNDSGGSSPTPTGLPSFPSFPSFTELPSSPSFSTSPSKPTTTSTTAKTTTTTTTAPRPNLPGTDGQGWVGSYARCDPGNPPALIAQTTKSLVVVCQAGPGNYYYRGVRMSDNASIELANTVRTSSGFDVTNPTDGTRYQVRPNVLNIISPGGQVDSEPMVQYVSS
jgi:hypothetical protein